MENGKLRVESEVSSEMKFRYRSEDEMKDSGVEWIGKIPKMWGLCKVKNIVKVKDGTHDTPKYVNKSADARPLITSKDIKNGKIDFSEAKYISYNDYIFINTRSDVKKGDVIMPMIGTVGNPVIVDTDNKFSIKNVALFKTCDNKNLSKFLTYAFQSIVMKEQLNLLTRGGVQNFASLSMLQNLKLVKIPNKYLNRIISFLDQKTSQFGSIISKKEALIQKLEEAKKSLISEVVTGKVKVVKTSEGYKLVKRKKEEMKDSGVEWIGNIPMNFKTVRLGLISFVTKLAGFEYTNYMADALSSVGEVPIVRAGNIKMNKFITQEKEFIDIETSKMLNRCALYKKCVLITFIGAGIGEVALFDKPQRHHLAPNVAKIEIQDENKQKINEQYLIYYLMSSAGQEEVNRIKKASAQPSLSMETIRSMKIVLPEIKEQLEINRYLSFKIKEIDKVTSKTKHQISKLKEAKQSLISEAVTGKIEILEN